MLFGTVAPSGVSQYNLFPSGKDMGNSLTTLFHGVCNVCVCVCVRPNPIFIFSQVHSTMWNLSSAFNPSWFVPPWARPGAVGSRQGPREHLPWCCYWSGDSTLHVFGMLSWRKRKPRGARWENANSHRLQPLRTRFTGSWMGIETRTFQLWGASSATMPQWELAKKQLQHLGTQNIKIRALSSAIPEKEAHLKAWWGTAQKTYIIYCWPWKCWCWHFSYLHNWLCIKQMQWPRCVISCITD